MKSGETKLFIGIVIVCAILVGAVLLPNLTGNKPSGPPPPNKVSIGRQVLVPPNSEIEGNPKAPFTLVEFGDYQ